MLMSERKFDGSLYLVTNEYDVDRSLEEIVEEAVAGGVTAVQLRDRADHKEHIVENAKKIQKFLRRNGVPLIINNFLDVFKEVGADGIHLGQSDKKVTEVRKVLGSHAIIGLSVETMAQAIAAEDLPVDYFGVSNIFGSRTKPNANLWGKTGLAELRNRTDHYLVAIGGVKQHNAREIIEAGADGVAVVSAIYAAADPRLAALKMRAEIEAAKNLRPRA